MRLIFIVCLKFKFNWAFCILSDNLCGEVVLVCKLAPIHGRPGETEERGRLLQIGRWQVLIKKITYIPGLS